MADIIRDASGNQNNLTNTGGSIARDNVGLARSVLIDDSIVANSIDIEINGIEYQLFSLKALKLNDSFAFEAILKRKDETDVPENVQA